MTVKLVTNFSELMRLAGLLGKAEKSGDPAAIAEAQAKHDAYMELCLKADRINLGVSRGELL